jgi:hypothetical protein
VVLTTVASGGGFHWGAVLIVLFTGLTFVIAALGYRVVRRSVGLGRAVKVSRSRSTWEPAQRLYDPWIGVNFTRLAIHLSHRVTFVPERSHLWWPRVRPVEFIPPDREMRIGESPSLTSYAIALNAPGYDWRSSTHCWVTVCFELGDGKYLRLRGRQRIRRSSPGPR